MCRYTHIHIDIDKCGDSQREEGGGRWRWMEVDKEGKMGGKRLLEVVSR